VSELENSGKSRNTTVIVSSDHGESFEGGIYQHENLYQTRPEIHVPLIIRTPDQQLGRTVAFTADQTALAPTILDLAGQPKPDWMPGQSLVKWLNSDSPGEGQGLAFCQYLENNSIFKPLQHGTVGVIDGQYQYVVILGNQNGVLRPLSEAQFWKINRSADHPERAEALRAAIRARFPGLVQEAA
jgi:arylsulfatase A-like enzyme